MSTAIHLILIAQLNLKQNSERNKPITEVILATNVFRFRRNLNLEH